MFLLEKVPKKFMEGLRELSYTSNSMEPIPQKQKIQKQLLRWFEKNGRDLP